MRSSYNITSQIKYNKNKLAIIFNDKPDELRTNHLISLTMIWYYIQKYRKNDSGVDTGLETETRAREWKNYRIYSKTNPLQRIKLHYGSNIITLHTIHISTLYKQKAYTNIKKRYTTNKQRKEKYTFTTYTAWPLPWPVTWWCKRKKWKQRWCRMQ